MPARPAKACRVMGCAQPDPCPVHSRLRAVLAERTRSRFRDRQRGSAAARGYGRRWVKFAAWWAGDLWHLRVPRAGLCGCRHPSAPMTTDSVCAQAHRPELATVVDHIVPIAGPTDPRLYDVTNLQGLCDRCHNQKRQREAIAARGAITRPTRAV